MDRKSKRHCEQKMNIVSDLLYRDSAKAFADAIDFDVVTRFRHKL